MSSRGAATLAVVRDKASSANELVSKAELGKDPRDSSKDSSWLDTLSQVAPTGIIAGYSAILTGIIAAIKEPTKQDPTPDQFAGWRVALWLVFAALAFGVALVSYRSQATPPARRTVPMEVWVSTLAFVVWAAASPGTWVTVAFSIGDNALRPVLVLAIAVIGTLVLSLFSASLRKKLPHAP